MATIGKDGTLGKEKKAVTSPSISNPHRPVLDRKKSPKLSTLTSLDHNKDHHHATTQSSSDKKQVPNYLRPTLSSRVEPLSKLYVVKKNAPDQETSVTKKTLNRRSSFDKPPSPSLLLHKAPLVATNSFRERSSSSSMHHSIPSSKKPISERTTTTTTKKVYKPVVKSQPLSVSNSKNKSTAVKKSAKIDAVNVEEKKAAKDAYIIEALNDISAAESDDQEVDRESFMSTDVEEELMKVESGVESFHPPDISTVPENIKELVHDTTNEDGEKLIKQPSCDISTVSEDTKSTEEINLEDHEQEKQNQEESCDNSHVEEIRVEDNINSAAETEAVNKEDEVEGATTDEHSEVKASDEKEEVVEEEGSSQRLELRERQDEEAKDCVVKEAKDSVVKEAKAEEAENVKVVKRQGGSVKKVDSPVYNDVIEETASKLLAGKKKSKVGALVGAFETVISLQEPEP